MEKKEMTNDIFTMLDQASVFSSGKPVKQDIEPVKKPREKNRKKEDKFCAEEKEYAKLIGYDLSDNEDEEFDAETAEDYLAKPKLSYSTGYKNKKGGYGRGSFLNYDYGNDNLLSINIMKSRDFIKPIRQEHKDRVISEQLRQVVGCGASNQEIEEAFEKMFRKHTEEVPVPILEENISIKDSDSSSVSSFNSIKSSRKSEREMYVPPALRKINDNKNTSIKPVDNRVSPCESVGMSSKGSTCDDNYLVFGERRYKTLSPIKFHPYPDEYGGSKVESICDWGGLSDDDSAKSSDKVFAYGDKAIKDHAFVSNSDEDVEIVEVKETLSEEKPNIKSKMIGRENNPMKLVRGRNALINSLLKKNAEAEFLLEPKELLDKDNVDLKSQIEASANFTAKSNYDIDSQAVGGLLRDQDGHSGNISFVSEDMKLKINDTGSNLGNNCSTTNRQSSSRYLNVLSSTNSVLNDKSKKKTLTELLSEDKSVSDSKKTYNQLILEEKSKTLGKKNFTLGDCLSSKSSNNPSGKSKKGSKLNPHAQSFTPHSSTSKDTKYDFKLNDDNFPPL